MVCWPLLSNLSHYMSCSFPTWVIMVLHLFLSFFIFVLWILFLLFVLPSICTNSSLIFACFFCFWWGLCFLNSPRLVSYAFPEYSAIYLIFSNIFSFIVTILLKTSWFITYSVRGILSIQWLTHLSVSSCLMKLFTINFNIDII